MAIVLKLSKVMKDKNVSLNELSKKVGVSVVNLSRIRTGKVSAIRFSTLEAICKTLKCQPGDFIKYNDSKVLERQYCASAYTIDFKNKKVLLMFNKKLNKWLQPGGHIEYNEIPTETAVRETKEETGIDIQIVGTTFDDEVYEPIATKRYTNSVGDMIDIQYLAVPLNTKLNSKEKNKTIWLDLNKLKDFENLDKEIKIKIITLYQTFREDYE